MSEWSITNSTVLLTFYVRLIPSIASCIFRLSMNAVSLYTYVAFSSFVYILCQKYKLCLVLYKYVTCSVNTIERK